MNNAYNNVGYHKESPVDEGAPISWMGAGELQVYKSLNASYWAFSLEDVQPSISLGVLNVASATTIRRTVRVTNLSPANHSLSLSSIFRDKAKEASDALSVEFQPDRIILPGNADACDTPNFIDLEVAFKIDATKIPPNHMTSAGINRDNATLTLDVNEYGGHLIISSETASTDISLPFLAILRQASNVSIANTRLKYDGKPTDISVGLTNNGAGVAQVDAFQVLALGKDEKEANFGDSVEKADLRMVGYRVVTPPSGMEGCTHMFEWAFQTWEPQARLQTTVFEVLVDVDGDRSIDYSILNAVVSSSHTASAGDILIRSAATGDVKCAGLHVDHHTCSTTTVIRVCSDDLGITEPGSLVAQTRVVTVRSTGEAELTATSPYPTLLTYPDAELSALSYDIAPGQTLESISVSGGYGESNGYPPLGLMLVTDACRSPESTGAAAKGTATLLVLADFVESNFELHKEKTTEAVQIPTATDLQGPICSWVDGTCLEVEEAMWDGNIVKSDIELGFSPSDTKSYENQINRMITLNFNLFQLQSEREETPSCDNIEVPRVFVSAITTPPTIAPVQKPSVRPTHNR